MKKRTFYILLSVWILAVAVFVGVLVNYFMDKNVSDPADAPGKNQTTEDSSGDEPEDPTNDEDWSKNY